MEEMAKRKQPAQDGDDKGGAAGGRSGDEEHREVTDEEVDEFFSVLRRLHAASKSFAGGGGRRDNKRKKKAMREEEEAKAAAMWRPRFTLEDFEAIGDGGVVVSDGAASGCRTAAEDPIPPDLDLNAEPVDEDRDWQRWLR